MKKETDILKAKVIHNGHLKTVKKLISEHQTDVILFYGKSTEVIRRSMEYAMFRSAIKVANPQSIAICCVQFNDASANENHIVVIDAFRELGNLFKKLSNVIVLKFDKHKAFNQNIPNKVRPYLFSSNPTQITIN
ncbi:MAG: hypothetical protein AAF688_08330 [Bacteroidota bacterium]